MFGRRLVPALMCFWSLSSSVLLAAQNSTPRFRRVYTGHDALAHVVTRSNTDRAIPAEPQQVAVSSPALSADGRIAGWLVEVENCCTSYPIPVSLVLYSESSHRVIGDGLMIYSWCFVPRTATVAIASGTVHGMQGQNLTLYNIRSGKQVRQWTGDDDAKPPTWAACLDKPSP